MSSYWSWPMVMMVFAVCVLVAAAVVLSIPANADQDVPSYMTDRMAERYGLEVAIDCATEAIAESVDEAVPVVEDPAERVLTRDEMLAHRIEQDAAVASRIVSIVGRHAPWSDDAFRYDISFAIARASRQHGVSPELVCALIKIESGFNPRAVSPTNDHGLMQLHGRPIYGVTENINAGVAHLGAAIYAEGSERAGLARYNGGPRKPGVSWGYADRVLALAGGDR